METNLVFILETCREEGIHCDVIVDYNDNAHCIDLISSLVSKNFSCSEAAL